MAYPSDQKPRRRLQAVPSMAQMVRRRAASPNGVVKNGVGLMGPPVAQGGVPVRRRPGWGGQATNPAQSGYQPGQGQTYAPTLPGANPAPKPYAAPNPFQATAQPVYLGPPATGGAGQAQAPSQPAYSGVNPNSLLDVGGPQTQRNPLEHLDWWAAQGWVYNRHTGRFHNINQAVDPSANPGPRPDPTGGGPGIPGGTPGPTTGGQTGGGGTTPPPGGTDPATGLPLDAYFEAQRRALNDALMARLGASAPQRELIAAQQGLQTARLGTNEQVDTRHLLESLAGRGAFGGGIQTRDQGYLGTDYLRQRQDLASNVASGYAGLAQGDAEAQAQYSSGLVEALLALAQRQATSQYAPVPTGIGTGGLPAPLPYDLGGAPAPDPVPTPTGGGGGGGWTPSWTPNWQPSWKPTWNPKGR